MARQDLEKYDGPLLSVAQQLTAGAGPGEDAIESLLDLYFGFLRRKTDFFSQEGRAKEAVLAALARQAALVSKEDAGASRALRLMQPAAL